MHAAQTHTSLIKEKARELGFMYCGISKAMFLEEDSSIGVVKVQN